jgi:hypothetical protein
MLPDVAALTARTVLAERPFTHPDRTFDDLRVLNRSLARLRAALHANLLQGDGPMTHHSWDDELGNRQRIIVRAGMEIQALPTLWLVGFFGQRRADADRLRMDGVDQALVDDMANEHGKIVCYYTAALENGQYGNMVLSSCDSARDRWNGAVRHARAVRELAPLYYRSVRLHNGVLEGGIAGAQGPALTVTKYFDYGSQAEPERAPWRAIRTWAPPARMPT